MWVKRHVAGVHRVQTCQAREQLKHANEEGGGLSLGAEINLKETGNLVGHGATRLLGVGTEYRFGEGPRMMYVL